MRMLLLTAILSGLLVSQGLAHDTTPKSKAPQYRTYIESIDMSESRAALRGFIDAYATSDFFKAYQLLSPAAKSAFMSKIFEYNEAQLFPGMKAGSGPAGLVSDGTMAAADLMDDINLDSAVAFDNTMMRAKGEGLLPFDFEAGVAFSPTFEHEDQARYILAGKGDPDALVISTIRLSNGDWRVDRIVWARSDPDARPWGFK